ncbi:MAG: phosphoenolpyruvate--protein phosphotransferase [Planctomycetia bacterium]|nr:phosphoenolpyruvate--protein phosphotransferase [Planctomycetia bacterium]
MKTYQGIPVSPGIIIGEAMIIDNGKCRINRRFISKADVEAELLRLENAILTASHQIAKRRDSATNELGKEYGQIFDAHLLILSDKKLKTELQRHIEQELFSAEYAVSLTFERQANLLRSIQHGGLAERINDIIDIETNLLHTLLGIRRESIAQLNRPVVVLATNLTPSETVNLEKEKVLGIATESGGLGSHTAIVASALQIPAVLGIGLFLSEVSDGDIVILDGKNGILIVEPDVETIRKFEQLKENETSFRRHLLSQIHKPAQTLDQTEIFIFGNIEFPYEAKICLENGASGIGLYRTEFLYLVDSPEGLPNEEVHFQTYKQVAESMGGKEGKVVTIRTFDLGADKLPDGFPFVQDEKNPFMGLRSIRLSLRNTDMFRTQLRAILRASAFGNFRIMLPLVSTVREFRKAKMLIADVREELYELGVPFDENIPIGIMVEVPSTVIMLGTFVHEVDFFSIGTNDLIQYTLAVDRSNKDVCDLYNAEDPAVIRLVKQSIKVATMYGKPISLCGQMSSNPINTILLLGLGLRHFSVSPGVILEIKEICRNVSISECQEIAQRVLFMENAADIRNYLKSELEKRMSTQFDRFEY